MFPSLWCSSLFGFLYTVYLFKSSFCVIFVTQLYIKPLINHKCIFVLSDICADNWSNESVFESPAAGQFSTDPVPLVCCCRGVFWSHRLDLVIGVSTEHHRINHQDAHWHVCVWNSKLKIVIKSWVIPTETTHHNVQATRRSGPLNHLSYHRNECTKHQSTFQQRLKHDFNASHMISSSGQSYRCKKSDLLTQTLSVLLDIYHRWDMLE